MRIILTLLTISFFANTGCQSVPSKKTLPPILGKLTKLKAKRGTLCFVGPLKNNLIGNKVNFVCDSSPCGYAKVVRIKKNKVLVNSIVGKPKEGAQAVLVGDENSIFKDGFVPTLWDDSFCAPLDMGEVCEDG